MTAVCKFRNSSKDLKYSTQFQIFISRNRSWTCIEYDTVYVKQQNQHNRNESDKFSIPVLWILPFECNYKLGERFNHLNHNCANTSRWGRPGSEILDCFEKMDMLKQKLTEISWYSLAWNHIAEGHSRRRILDLLSLCPCLRNTSKVNLLIGFKWGRSFLGSAIFIKFLLIFFPS